MRTLRFICAVAVLVMLATAAGDAQSKYTGAKFCAACHKGGKGGTAYTVWEKSAHAGAYKTLLGEAAVKVGKEKGLKVAPSEAPECLKCHVSGGGAAAAEASFKKEEGVTCEACHGAASGYKMIHSKPENLDKAKAAGLMLPGKEDAKMCEKCHNAESPTFKGFKMAEMWAKIEHGKAK